MFSHSCDEEFFFPYCMYQCYYYASDTWDFPEESWPKQNSYYNNKNDFWKNEMGPRTGCGNPNNCGGMWSEWSSCSVTCGIGIQTSKRIEAQQPQNGRQPCTGPSTKERNCGMPNDECQTTTTIATATMTTTTVKTITLTTTVAPTTTSSTTLTPTTLTTSTVTQQPTTTTTSSTHQSGGMYFLY